MGYLGSLCRCDEVSSKCHRDVLPSVPSTMNIMLAYLQTIDTPKHSKIKYATQQR